MRNWKSFCKTPWLKIYYCSAVFHPQQKFTFSWKKRKSISLENKHDCKVTSDHVQERFFFSPTFHIVEDVVLVQYYGTLKNQQKRNILWCTKYFRYFFRYFFSFSNMCFMSGVLNTLGPLFCEDVFSCMKKRVSKMENWFKHFFWILQHLRLSLMSFFLSKKLPALIKQELAIIIYFFFYIVGNILLK